MPVFSSSCICPPYKFYDLIISLRSCHCPHFFTLSSHFFVPVVTVCIALLHNFFHKYWFWLFRHRKCSYTPFSVAFSLWFWPFRHRKRSLTPFSVAFSLWSWPFRHRKRSSQHFPLLFPSGSRIFQTITQKSSTRWYSEFPDTSHGWSCIISL